VGDERHLKYLWGGVKTNKIEYLSRQKPIVERLFRLRGCLPDRATERDFMEATTETESNSLKIRKDLII
jgi:hypothetical protein